MKTIGDRLDKNWSLNCPEDQRKGRQVLWQIHSGGVAGVMSWIFTIPQDIIKTK